MNLIMELWKSSLVFITHTSFISSHLNDIDERKTHKVQSLFCIWVIILIFSARFSYRYLCDGLFYIHNPTHWPLNLRFPVDMKYSNNRLFFLFEMHIGLRFKCSCLLLNCINEAVCVSLIKYACSCCWYSWLISHSFFPFLSLPALVNFLLIIFPVISLSLNNYIALYKQQSVIIDISEKKNTH